jgi:hypothetical protein
MSATDRWFAGRGGVVRGRLRKADEGDDSAARNGDERSRRFSGVFSPPPSRTAPRRSPRPAPPRAAPARSTAAPRAFPPRSRPKSRGATPDPPRRTDATAFPGVGPPTSLRRRRRRRRRPRATPSPLRPTGAQRACGRGATRFFPTRPPSRARTWSSSPCRCWCRKKRRAHPRLPFFFARRRTAPRRESVARASRRPTASRRSSPRRQFRQFRRFCDVRTTRSRFRRENPAGTGNTVASRRRVCRRPRVSTRRTRR